MTMLIDTVVDILANQKPGPSATAGITAENRIKHSRIDFKAVDGLWRQMHQIGLTEKQRSLVLHLIQKYRRQLSNVGVDVESVLANVQWKSALREITPIKSRIWVENNFIKFSFHYDSGLIDRLHKLSISDTFMAKLEYLGKGTKTWNLEFNAAGINLAYTLYNQHKFDATEDLIQVFLELDAIYKEKNYSYVSWDGQWQIHNAAPSQSVAAEETIKTVTKFEHQIIDFVHQGFDIDDSAKLELLKTWQPREASIIVNRNYFIETRKFDTNSLIEFLEDLDMWPVLLTYGWYKDFDKILPQFEKAFTNVVHMAKETPTKINSVPDNTKLLIAKQLPQFGLEVNIPILVTYTGLMGQYSDKYSAAPYHFKKVLHVEPPL